MFKDTFNLLNVVHKRCILNSNEFCTHLEILKRIFKVVFLFSYQSSVLKELSDLLCFFKFLSLPYRGDLIIIAPPLPYVNNFFQLFSIFLHFLFMINQKNCQNRLFTGFGSPFYFSGFRLIFRLRHHLLT